MATAADVRAWAREQGYEVGSRGHLPGDVVAAFNKGKRQNKRFEDTHPTRGRRDS